MEAIRSAGNTPPEIVIHVFGEENRRVYEDLKELLKKNRRRERHHGSDKGRYSISFAGSGHARELERLLNTNYKPVQVDIRYA